MATVRPNPSAGVFRGKIGNLVYATYPNDRVIVRRRPVHTAESTPAEKRSQGQFAKAIRYMRDALATPELRAIYRRAARLRGKRACDLATADFLVPPIIHGIELTSYTGAAQQPIVVQASDNFELFRVQVEIRDLTGNLFEQGPALEREEASGRFIYWTQGTISQGQTVVVLATAMDRPGNVVTSKVDYALLEPAAP